jgi:hypothetical protein
MGCLPATRCADGHPARARADGEHQAAVVGNQVAGRVGFFLRVDDFEAAYERMTAAGVEFVTSPPEFPTATK